MTKIGVIIPAYNEEKSIGKVIADIPSLVTEIVVVDNNSKDQTAAVAKNAGATVLLETFQGYGAACLKGIEYYKSAELPPEIIVFLDADYSDYPEEIPLLIEPILSQKIDMVIGSRALGSREDGAMMPQQIFGNWLATRMLQIMYRANFTDLGPFRAIKFDKLLEIKMQDKTYGWTVEMQAKAVKNNLTYCEVPVNYKKRIGVSKVSGTLKGTILAGYKIISTIFKYR